MNENRDSQLADLQGGDTGKFMHQPALIATLHQQQMD